LINSLRGSESEAPQSIDPPKCSSRAVSEARRIQALISVKRTSDRRYAPWPAELGSEQPALKLGLFRGETRVEAVGSRTAKEQDSCSLKKRTHRLLLHQNGILGLGNFGPSESRAASGETQAKLSDDICPDSALDAARHFS
jgi:hypothetical protein